MPGPPPLVNCWEYNAEFVVVVVNVTVMVDEPVVVTGPNHISMDWVATFGLVNCTGVRIRVHCPLVTPPPDTVDTVIPVPATTALKTSTSPAVVGLTDRVECTDPNPVDAIVPTAEIGSANVCSLVDRRALDRSE